MQFPSPSFALFMLAILPLWHALGARPRARNALSLLLCAGFLGVGGWLSPAVAACVGAATWLATRVAPSLSSRSAGACSVALLLPLAGFKYGAWFADAGLIPQVLAWRGPQPLGLSFYTFCCLAWFFAVREGSWRGPAHAALAGAFFFPAVASGPVLRPSDAAASLAGPTFYPELALAAPPFLLGFFLKLVVASRLAEAADPVFSNLAAADSASLALALHIYAGQLYADFAGYSLMAVGVGRALGVELPMNFNAPYLALSVADFWRRWHISLSSFWRDRIYVPLGGSRSGRPRELANLMAVMLLCGLWHGAGLCFLAWGAIHGLLLCAGRAWRWSGAPRLPALLAWFLTFEAVIWAWLPFRLPDMERLAGAAGALSRMPSDLPVASWTILACALALAAEHARGASLLSRASQLGRSHPFAFLFLAVFVLLACMELAPEGIPAFIYASF